MQSGCRNGILALALLAVVLGLPAIHRAAAPGEHPAPDSSPYAAVSDAFSDDTTGSIHPSGSPRLRLSDEQRGLVFLGVINLPDVPDVTMTPPKIMQRLPQDVVLHAIPEMVTHMIPQLARFRFVKLDDRILLVSAGRREVVAEIPRYKLIVR